MIFHSLTREVLKTDGEARGFQHFPRDLAIVITNDKIMFDRYYFINSKASLQK